MKKTIPERGALEPMSTWDLTPLFPTDSAWEAEFTKAGGDIDAFSSFAGTLHTSAQTLLHALDAENGLSLSLERLYVYAHMRRDEDNAVTKYQGMTDRAMQLMAGFGANAAFMAPEILQIPEDTLKSWLNTETLAPYRRVLKELLRARQHTLSEPEEKLLALAAEPLAAADQVFTMLNNADIRFGVIKDEDGNEVELSQGNYRLFIESRDRAVREQAYHTLYAAYIKLKNTLAASYTASVKADVFHARARKHEGALSAALFPGNVPLSVYDGLILAVEDSLGALGDYLTLRKKLLGLDELRMYDLYVPIVEEKKQPMEYAEAAALVKRALAPLGADYAASLDRAFNERWIDVHENRGKTTGAYSWGAYGTHPYVLLNYQDDADYAFTIAHELGHAMHSYYSDKALPYHDAQYRIMAAEVASTVNEILLTHYLLKEETDKKRRAYLINHYLEQFRTTVFRQTMFAAFEQQTHAMCERGEPLTVDSLCDLYAALNEKYYPGVRLDDEIRMEWARIPHFYNAFYVYQYATGFLAAVKLAGDILAGHPENYLAFLRSGGSDYPIALLKRAGADLADPATARAGLAVFADTVKQFTGE